MNGVSSAAAGSLILVNAGHPCPKTPPPETLMAVGAEGDGALMERRAALLLNQLMGHMSGWSRIAAVSGWRSSEEQQRIWDSSLGENGEEFTKKFVAVPGCSEHQTGLAVDLGLRQEDVDFICPDFPYTGICQTFRQRAARYGFIQRYPSGKEHITGIAHEPWHFRYVGIPHGEIMEKMEITLEEYLLFLRQHPAGERPFVFQTGAFEFDVSYLPIGRCDIFPAKQGWLISGDNDGGLILTTWRSRKAKAAPGRVSV